MSSVQTHYLLSLICLAVFTNGAGALESADLAQSMSDTTDALPPAIQYKPPTMVQKPKALAVINAEGRCSDKTQPCFKDVDDMLDGQHTILERDDLFYASQNVASFEVAYLPTANSVFDEAKNQSIGLLPPSSLDPNAVSTAVTPLYAGRMFDIGGDTLVFGVDGYDPADPTHSYERTDTLPPVVGLYDSHFGFRASQAMYGGTGNASFRHRVHSMQSADFNGDGFKDVVLNTADFDGTGYLSIGLANAAGGLDWPNLTTGRIGGYDYGDIPTVNNSTQVVVGDFNDDGIPDVANLVPDDGNKGLRLFVHLVRSAADGTVRVEQGKSYPLDLGKDNKENIPHYSITAGRFGPTTHDQLALVYTLDNNTPKIVSIRFSAGLDPKDKTKKVVTDMVQSDPWDTSIQLGAAAAPVIRSGRFAGQAFEQAAVLIGNSAKQPGGGFRVGVVNFDATNLKPYGSFTFTRGDCPNDLVVGNFDKNKVIKTPDNKSETVADPDAQIAVLTSRCGGSGSADVSIIDVVIEDGKTTPKPAPTPNPDGTVPINYSYSVVGIHPGEQGTGGRPELSLAKGDFQGRSLQLGAPTKLTVNNVTRAQTILAAPPMHVYGWERTQADNTKVPEIFNVTFLNEGYTAGFNFTTNVKQTQSTTNSTTWSWGAKQSTENGFEAGDCQVGNCLNVNNKTSAQQALEGSDTTKNAHFSEKTSTIKSTTGVYDKVSYSQETMTIFVYPVIGKTVCPNTKPDCAEEEQVPMLIHMAGPDTISNTLADADGLSWYQPVWMPGNIFSYPGSLEQLKIAAFPTDPGSFSLQGDTDTSRFTVGGTGHGSISMDVNWSGGSSNGDKHITKHNYSGETSINFQGKWGIGSGIFSFVNKSSFSFYGSKGFNNLNDSLTELSQSTGVNFSLTAAGLSPDPSLEYQVTPYIFGQMQPGGVVDSQELSSDVKTFGALRIGYAVDFGANGESCCTFWHRWYGHDDTTPDIHHFNLALNHPRRWYSVPVGSADACRGSGNCAQLSQRLPAHEHKITDSYFHEMRGLFIQSAKGQTAQLGGAEVGEKLVLSARVYNLSLDSMPSNAEVHVRFMAMPWNAGNSTPAGASFQIGEQIVGPITPFNDGSTTAVPTTNWVLVPQTFDTGGTNCGGQSCENKDLAFWVVVWAEDGAGNLMTELASHGLTGKPASDDFLETAELEEPFSDNLGFYPGVFQIWSKPTAPATTLAMSAQALAKPANPQSKAVRAKLVGVGAEDYSLRLGEDSTVAAKVKVGSIDLETGMEVKFFDGHPDHGGKLFGLMSYAYLASGKTYDFRANFIARECGKHLIYVEVGDNTGHDQIGRLETVRVACTAGERKQFSAQTQPLAFIPR